jgi:hypothetical protein
LKHAFGIVFYLEVRKSRIMKLFSAIAGGFAGATVLTLLHEAIKRTDTNAPRMDLLGMEAIEKSLKAVNAEVPDEENLFKITMAGDIISNSLYYSLAAVGDERKVIVRGALLGLAAGLGAVYLPKPLGLNGNASNRTSKTKLIATALYLTGGLVASLVSKLLEKSQR